MITHSRQPYTAHAFRNQKNFITAITSLRLLAVLNVLFEYARMV